MSYPKCSLRDLDRTTSLSGDWEFQLDPRGALGPGDLRPDRTIAVPLPWQAAFPDLRRYTGYAWYRRTFEVEGDIDGGDLRLRFGAVDYWCAVYLNGIRLAEHEGGYTPFELGLRSALRPGENELAVRVFDTLQTSVRNPRWPDAETPGAVDGETPSGPPFAAADIPHGKQDWYVNTSGIWQDVTLTPRPARWIERLAVTPDLAQRRAEVEVVLGGDVPPEATTTIHLEVRADDETVASRELPLPDGARTGSCTLGIPDVRAWDVESPFLYQLVGSLRVGERGTETVVRFGMRSFRAANGRFELNGEPFYLVGVLDQDFWPVTVSNPPSAEALRAELVAAKQLGFNTVRCHLKPPDPTYLDLADEIGLLVWEELPAWRTHQQRRTTDVGPADVPPAIRRRAEATLDALIERDVNHPSVVIRTLVNEDWGTSLQLSASDRQWLAALYERARRQDPTRLVVDNSACAAPWGTSFHVKTDVEDFHTYATIPDQADAFDGLVDDLAGRPLWTFSPFGDGERRGDEPIVLSEFGNWSLPTLTAGQGAAAEPAWFDVRPFGAGWEQEVGAPAGVLRRFATSGLDAIWADYDAFAAATQAHQQAALRYQIGALRRHPSIAGYVVTELTDTYWESNGLLDFERRPKTPIAEIAAFNRATAAIATPERWVAPSGEDIPIEVHMAAFDGSVEAGGMLEWIVGPEGAVQRTAIPPVAAGRTARVATVSAAMPAVEQFTTIPVTMSIVTSAGARIPASVSVAALPRPARGSSAAVICLDDADAATVARIAAALEAAGHGVRPDTAAPTDVAVSAAPSDELLDWVAAGGRLLFLAGRRSPFFWTQPRDGQGGGWITSWSWIRDTVHNRLRGTPNPLGMAFVHVMPEWTIAGLPLEDASVQPDVLSGMVTGWVRHPTAHTIQFRLGRGLVLMTTFRLRSTVGNDPVATALFLDLVEHLASDRCRPALAAQRGSLARGRGDLGTAPVALAAATPLAD